MNAIAVLAAVATIFAAGFGGLALMLRNPERLHLAEYAALSWLIGTGMVSLAIWLLGFLVRGGILFAAVTVFCVAMPAIAWKTRGAFRFLQPRAPNPLEYGLGCIVLVQVLAIGYLSVAYTLGWDGILNWEIKARYAFMNGGALPATYFQDLGRTFSHPEYPLAIPFTELWLYLWVGEASQFWAKTIFPIFYASGAVLLVAISARLTGKSWTGFVAAIALFFIPEITVEAGSTIVGYADFPLSVFYCAAIGYLLCAARRPNLDLFRVYLACLTFLPWLKREGTILWLIAAVCGAFIIWRSKFSPKYLLGLLGGLAIASGWSFYLRQMHTVSSADFTAVNFTNLAANIHRLGPILRACIVELTDTRAWGLFWFLTPITAVYFVWRNRDKRSIVFFIAVAAPLGAYAFSYIFSDWLNYQRHVGLSLSRLFMHVTPLVCLALSAALASLPSWRVAFCRSKASASVAATTCEVEFPERTAGIDFA